MEAKILETLIHKGPMTVKRISKTVGLSKALIRGILWYSKQTCLTWRAPLSRNKKPMWSYSETQIRPQITKKVDTPEPEAELP